MSNWTKENIEFLEKNWGKCTAREISEKMGAGFTRNSIIGKASRLGLSAKIKTRTATSNKNFENSLTEKNNTIRKGRKNKKGFFAYNSNGKKKGVDVTAYDFFKGKGNQSLPISDIQDRAIFLMLNEAVLCLEEEIIENPTDGDLGAVFGIGFLPFTGGPFRALDTWGIADVVARMEDFKIIYGERFTPAKTLVKMAKEGSTFY